MSRIGKLPVPVPAGVEVKIDGNTVTVKGSDGTTYVEGTSDYTITVSSYEA